MLFVILQVSKQKKEPNGSHGDISQFEEDNIKLQVSIGKWKLIVRSFRLSDQSCPVGDPKRPNQSRIEGISGFQDLMQPNKLQTFRSPVHTDIPFCQFVILGQMELGDLKL